MADYEGDDVVRAVCMVNGPDGVTGVIKFAQKGDGPTRVSGTVSGLAAGPHGFHIHHFGNMENGCVSCGGHFNPHGREHGGPDMEERHVGDLGNVVATEGEDVEVLIEDNQVNLSGPDSVVGRAIVIHAGEDDLGQGGHDDSKTTGHAGGRVACGIIGIA